MANRLNSCRRSLGNIVLRVKKLILQSSHPTDSTAVTVRTGEARGCTSSE